MSSYLVDLGASGGSQLGLVMAAEMAEQPACLAALVTRRAGIAADVRALVPGPLAGTVLVARGSSDHAARCGAYLLEMATGRPVASASPSLYTLYGATTDFNGYLVIAVSQSGRTPEIVEVVLGARQRGARVIAVTNDGSSPLADAADLVVDLASGPEKAVPATKTVTAQLLAFALVAEALGPLSLDDRQLSELPDQVASALASSAPVEDLVHWLVGSDRVVTVARGLLYGAASEVALKVEETTGRLTAAFSAADLRHGPIAAASGRLPVLAFAHPGPACRDIIDVVKELNQRGAQARLLGPVEGSAVTWAPEAPEALAPVLAVVRGQQVALHLARALGLDPDAPPGLNKVTIT